MGQFANFYSFLFVFLILIYMINRCLIEQFQKRELYVYFIILFLVAALRANTVGGDLENYIPHFQEVSQTDFQYLFDLRKSNYEVGYTILIKLITLILGSERSFFVVTSFISLLGVFVLIKNFIRSGISWGIRT